MTVTYGWLHGVGRVQLEGHVAMSGRQYERLLAQEAHSQSCIHFEHDCPGCPCDCHRTKQ